MLQAALGRQWISFGSRGTEALHCLFLALREANDHGWVLLEAILEVLALRSGARPFAPVSEQPTHVANLWALSRPCRDCGFRILARIHWPRLRGGVFLVLGAPCMYFLLRVRRPFIRNCGL